MGFGWSRAEHQYSVPVEGTEKEGESPIFRNPQSPQTVELYDEQGMTTVYELLSSTSQRLANNNYLGTRQKDSSGNFGEYQWITYGHAWQQANLIQSGLVQIDAFSESPENLRCFGIFSKNRTEWVLFDLACLMQSITSIPMVDAQGDTVVNQIIDFTTLKTLAISKNNFSRIINSKKAGQVQTLQKLVQFEDVDDEQRQEAQQYGIELYSLAQIIALGEQNQVEHNRPEPDNIYTICFTSGTTGMPKGALVTHKSLVSMVASIKYTGIELLPSDSALSYLPLSHMMERVVVMGLSYFGGRIGFFSGDITQIRSDLTALQPTLFVSVPRLFNRFSQLIRQRFDETTGMRRILLNRALHVKLYRAQNNGTYTHMLYDRLIFNNIRNILGGRVRYMVTGSAPISLETINFLKAVFCCPVVEAYGQTETCGLAFCTAVDDVAGGNVGGPIVTAEFKLISVPEMKYNVTDTDENGQAAPRGEILIRGPVVFKGYYRNPEETNETIDSDGWEHTGDIGIRLPNNGALRLLDRRKNIFKLAQGEYVAVERVESALTESLYVSQMFIYGDSMQSQLVGIIVPDQLYCQKWATNNQVEYSSFEELCNHPGLKQTILDDLKRVSREAGLPGYEIVANIQLEPKPWTTDDLLTYTQKLKRFDAKEYYANALATLYTQLQS